MGLNPTVRQIILKRMNESSEDGRRGVPGSGRGRDRASDSASERDYRSGYSDGYSDARRDFASGEDGRRGVKGTGRYGIGGRDRADNADMAHDFDSGEEIYLPDSEIEKWKRRLQNNDGSNGPHFGYSEVLQAARHCGITFDKFTKEEFCMAMNMLYSDLCKTNSKYITKDKELEYYACLAKEWLSEDADGPTAEEKLAVKYYMTAH